MPTELSHPAAIVVQQLHKTVRDSVGELTILKPTSFIVNTGSSVAIVGASGSGKSTLLGLLAGLDTPTAGTVILNGRDIFAADEETRAQVRRENIGFVYQSFQLLPHLNALENVMLPLDLAGTPAREGKRMGLEMLERVGLTARATHFPRTLSGGEQQRVALARAFVARAPILLADEPTGSLDAATGQAVIQLMFELKRDAGATLVLVTHDENLAKQCDTVLRMEAGALQG